MWIITCFMAMSYTPFDAVVTNYNKAAWRLVAAAKKKSEDASQ